MATKRTPARKKKRPARASLGGLNQSAAPTANQRQRLGQTVLVVVGLGAGAYLVGKAVSHALSGDTAGTLLLPASTSTSTSTTAAKKVATTTTASSTGFPLTYGMSKNALVRVMQQAILARGGQAGAEIRDSGGADGAFGPGTKRALAALGEYNTTSVDESAFKRITQMASIASNSTTSSSSSPVVVVSTSVLPVATLSASQVSTIQSNLKNYIDGGSASFYAYLLKALAQIKNAGDYQLVNENGAGLMWSFFSFSRTTIAAKLSENWSTDGGVTQQLTRIGLRRGSDSRWYLPTGALA